MLSVNGTVYGKSSQVRATSAKVFVNGDDGDRLTNTFKKDFLCSDKEHIFGGDQGDPPEIMDEILTTPRDLELEVNEDDIEKLIMGHEDELTTEEL
ncbi:uncharacterized protein TNCV_3356091 [Trichonephila clavipes]|nr:uncharacterized protein TNCV_3356091 [Trichonephila clavipes]